MKKFVYLLIGFFLFTSLESKAISFSESTTEVNADYLINDAEIDAKFASSTDISAQLSVENQTTTFLESQKLYDGATFKQTAASDKNAVLAIVLDLFVGGLGLHRAYLGTKTFTWVGYILTCGGIFGIVPLVDLFVLIFNAGDISKYVDNSKFFMW